MDLPVNQFKRALREGRPQIGLWSVLADAAVVELLGGAGGLAGSGLPSAGPNASVLTRSRGTPNSARFFLTASIIGTGPQMWT